MVSWGTTSPLLEAKAGADAQGIGFLKQEKTEVAEEYRLRANRLLSPTRQESEEAPRGPPPLRPLGALGPA